VVADDRRRRLLGVVLERRLLADRHADAFGLQQLDDKYQDYLLTHGLGVEMAEALAEYVHKRIRGELGLAGDDDRDMERMLQQGYRGSRYSFGYPACPNLEDQRLLLDLLGAGAIGLELSEEHQLHPEQSTSALVIHHPKAKYFSV
jgi:5-methyltetrahydrofolate--homocysteine methyltransferase